ncbi:MAG TPA: coenzyme F420-0:L-glutamate ligase [Actinomycetota bacterium]|jgi:coenzyme F420-0:L-glutamate ligase/coenzyme F420-1:gamma-L-glutamate ligase|nr:coenzyme F420-0:L-glutamate ligase [Actinomycetota bacterium]
MTVELHPVEGLPEVRPGDDLASLLVGPLGALDPRDGDVLAVTQKIVSKAEGRVVAGGDRAEWIERETERVVARRGDLVITETRHGFVCANAGVDASNVEGGSLTLLPEDADESAERLRAALGNRLGLGRFAVVITDTFGRPWRQGLVNVAIGCAGLPALVDLRGLPDHHGRALEATIVALADEVAAASGLVMAKAGRVPAALVRGLPAEAVAAPPAPARSLVRPAEEDLFRESPLQALHARRTIRSFAEGEVPRDALEEAVMAACTAPAPHHTRPWRFSVLTGEPARRALLAALAEAWRTDLRRDGTPEEVILRRIARSDAVLGMAPVLIVPWIRFRGAHPYADAERAHAEREMFLLAGGAAIQNLLLALHARGLASCWISSTLFCQEETRAVLGIDDEWFALGTVAAGLMPEGGAVRPRPPLDLADVLRWS